MLMMMLESTFNTELINLNSLISLEFIQNAALPQNCYYLFIYSTTKRKNTLSKLYCHLMLVSLSSPKIESITQASMDDIESENSAKRFSLIKKIIIGINIDNRLNKN
ncbi:mitochondrial intermediate peptidase [Sarcoptes scabiei]|nr:mitochondrial intermediate peptidase [Sarcoptes scabiei]